MLIASWARPSGGLPAGLAEFTNDGKFIRRIENPSEAPYGYDVAIKPDLNRMVTQQLHAAAQLPEAAGADGPEGLRQASWSSGTSRTAQPLQVGKAGLAPLEVRWSLKPENNYGFTNCALDNSIWMFKGNGERHVRVQEGRRHRHPAGRPAPEPRRPLPLS